MIIIELFEFDYIGELYLHMINLQLPWMKLFIMKYESSHLSQLSYHMTN